MGIITPQNTGLKKSEITPRKSFADTKRWLSGEIYQALSRFKENPDGDSITYAQDMIQDLVDMATDREQDAYLRLAAKKFIVEHLEGKAQTMSDEVKEEMPKLVICVGDVTTKQIKETLKDEEGAVPKEDVLVEISDDNGENSEEMIV